MSLATTNFFLKMFNQSFVTFHKFWLTRPLKIVYGSCSLCLGNQ